MLQGMCSGRRKNFVSHSEIDVKSKVCLAHFSNSENRDQGGDCRKLFAIKQLEEYTYLGSNQKPSVP